MITAVAVCGAVALVVSGPVRPLSFDVRLPFVVLAVGAAWTALAARRPADGKRPAVPMATPWLILTATAGVALLTLKLLTVYPALDGALFAVGAAICCLAVGAYATGGRRHDIPRPDSADALAGEVPGQAVADVTVSALPEGGPTGHPRGAAGP